MKRAAAQDLTDAVAQFQADLRRLALQIVQAVLQQELDRRLKERKPPRQLKQPRSKPTGKATRKQRKPRAARTPRKLSAESQLELGLTQPPPPTDGANQSANANDSASANGGDGAAQAAGGAAQPAAPLAPGKRKRWTRDSIVEELATWLLGRTAIDAQFVSRHGPPGLVAAARRIFGRFDAALNVASLHVSKLYPDGPPTNRAGVRRAPAATAAEPAAAEPVEQA